MRKQVVRPGSLLLLPLLDQPNMAWLCKAAIAPIASLPVILGSTQASWRLMSALPLVVEIRGLQRQFACDGDHECKQRWVNVHCAGRKMKETSIVRHIGYDVMSCH
ncbi:hypothetical protein F5Y09DRAFT_312525 [Xylaria sp. FL1042]|nr:hypothetical protein F5Y09DRAFT_312525 [Xylaria sp. FL1042]